MLRIRQVLREHGVRFSQASSTWPGRMVRAAADELFESSVDRYLARIGWREDAGRLVPLKQA